MKEAFLDMPFLKFRCKKCGKVFDELVALLAMDKVRCPECAGETERAYEGKCAGGKGCCGDGCGGDCCTCGGCSH